MVNFLDLPDVVLLLVIGHLPVWKLSSLAVLCRKLHSLIESNFKSRCHLRLCGGILCNKYRYTDDVEIGIIDFPAEYDLVIRFQDCPPDNPNEFANFVLSADLGVAGIAKMMVRFPKITHLTLVLANEWPTEFVVQLLIGWSDMESLKIVNYSNFFLDWQQAAPVIASMAKLEHFVFYASSSCEFINRKHFDTFIRKGQLKTYISTDYSKYISPDRKKYINDRSIWNKPEYAQAVQKLETFGVLEYDISSESDFSNVELLRKFKRVHVNNWQSSNNILHQVNLTNWTALQCLALDIDKVCFSQLFATLSVLANLEDFSLRVKDFQLPKARSCKLWTRFPSVRRFQLVAHLDAHEFYKVANCVPNANDCSLKLRVKINTENDGPEEYFARRRTLQGPLKLCNKCVALMKRAIEKHRCAIESFIWFRQIGEDGKQSMVPTARLFTEDVGGTTRFNTKRIPIH